MTIVNHPLVIGAGPPELADQPSGPTCNVELRNSTASDLFVVIPYYSNNITVHSDEKHENKSDSIIKIKVRHSKILADIRLEGPPKFTVFRSWPRPPSDRAIPDELHLIHRGKTTPNGLPWGATVFDFYHFALDSSESSNIYSGSQLLEWSKAIGEAGLAKDEIEWASMEEMPRIVELYPPSTSVVIQEENIRARKDGWGIPMPNDVALDSIDYAPDGERSISTPPNYQNPWPLVPFSYPTECLQTHIPIHRLPKKIVVHDPWNLLAMDSQNRYGKGRSESMTRDTNWLEKPDIIHTYNLNLSSAGEARLREELEIIDEESRFNSLAEPISQTNEIRGGAEGLHGYLLQSHANTSPGPIVPPIFVAHDLPPSIGASTIVQPPHNDGAMEETHLYLSPAHNAGAGNHSIAYKAEWEIPRTTFLPPAPRSPVLCKECVEDDVKRILAEEDGENGERMQAQWKEKSALLQKVAQVVRPSVRVRFARAEGPRCDISDDKADDNICEPYVVYPEDTTYKIEIEGPVRVIWTTIAWQDPSRPSCEHLLSQLPIPPTAKCRVIAKLSLSRDDHLEREALNYQNFDQHMFEHWSGLNRLSSQDCLSPVGAIVPQFYGHYIPQLKEDEIDEWIPYYLSTQQKSADQSEGATKFNRGYLSPILLLEDCGQTIGRLTDKMERNEVFSLVHRFHSADWAHGSIAERNILVQPGPLNVPPEARTGRSFRLIDFGRSIKASDSDTGYYHGRLSTDKKSLWYL